MKTIEQAAKESSEKAGYNPKIASDIIGKTVYECAFKAGVMFSQRWIPVSEELPTEFEKQILVKNENYNYVDLCFFNHQKQFELMCKIHNYTHWRPISFL